MALLRWDTLLVFDEVRDRLHRIFSNVALAHSGTPAKRGSKLALDSAPRVDIVETDAEFVVKVALPEGGEEGVKLSLEGGVLRIEGGGQGRKQDGEGQGHPAEGSSASFVRLFTLSDDVDEQQVQAEFKDGILNIRLPKGGGDQRRSGQVAGARPTPLGKSDPETAKMVWRLRRAENGAVVVLQAGDPLWAPPGDAVEWDWETDTASAQHHCALCGSVSEPLFKLEDGAIACGSCLHGSNGSR